MKKASFALLITLKIFLLLYFSCMIVPFLILDYGALLLTDLPRISLVLLEIVILIGFLSLSIYGLVFTLKFLLNPNKHFLATWIVTQAEKNLQRRIEKLSKDINAFSPTLLQADGIPDVFTFGLSKDNSYIIVSPSFLQNLDDDELTTVFLHEMFHIKEDVEYQSFRMVWYKAINTPINFLYFALASVVGLLPFPLFFGGWGGFPPIVFSSFETVYPMWKGFVLGCVTSGLILMALGFLRLWQEGTISGKYLYIRELLADSYSAVMSGKPLKLYSAIVKATKRRVFSTLGFRFYDKISFAYSPEKRPQIQDDITLADIFKTRMTSLRDLFGLKGEPGKTSCPIRYRLSLLKALQQLIYGNVNVVYLKSFHSIPSFSRLRMPETVVKLLRDKKVLYREFLDYLDKTGSKFNLVECANLIRVEPFEAFLMLFAAINSGIVDVKVKT